MSERHVFEHKDAFLAKLSDLIAAGIAPDRITIYTPYHVHETDHLLHVPYSALRYFTLLGALTGLAAGFGLTIYTVHDWPLIVGGKPLISWPPFTIIAFELTILFGAIASLVGFLLLARLPSIKGIAAPVEHDNRFVLDVAPKDPA